MVFFFEHHGMEGTDSFRTYESGSESFPLHMHRAYELIYVNSGALSLQVEQKQYLLEAGDLAFIFCNQVHGFSTPDKSDTMVALFSPEFIGDFYSAYKNHVPENNVVRMENPPDFFKLQSRYAQKSMLYHVCDKLLAASNMEPVGNRSRTEVLQKIFAYVDKHFSEDCSLKTVSRSIKYDYAYLSKLFSRLTGMRFSEYLNLYRISQACYLLKTEKKIVSEIAAICGYTTLRTFHRNFRMVMGCAPREYLAGSKSFATKKVL